jgi:hypothetical protein
VVVSTLSLRGTTRVGGKSRGSFFAYTRLTDDMVREVRRNNRNARSELRRQSTAGARAAELRDRHAKDEQPIFDQWAEMYEHAWLEGQKYALSPEHGGAVWRHNIT